MNISLRSQQLKEPIAKPEASGNSDVIKDVNDFPSICCSNFLIKKTNDATGFGVFRMGNGVTVMSMVFLSSALMSLAENEEEALYGIKSSSLITAIGTVSGILSAIMLPFMGALVDCTPSRRKIGKVFTITLVVIQTIQIGTVQSTWRFMALLQAINGFVFQVTILAAYSYLPEIGRDIGEKLMTEYSSDYFIMMFGMESIYLVSVIGISIYYELGDVLTAQVAQVMNIVLSGFCYYYGWKFLTKKKARRELSKTEPLFLSGFLQVFRTASGISKHYGSSLGWFLLAVTFAEAGTNALTLVSVTYLKEAVEFSGTEIGIMFLIVIFCTIPGSAFGAWVTNKTNPKTSIKLQLVFFIIVNFAAFTTMTEPHHHHLAYYYGILWGISLGWFYPTESLIFSMIMPKGQEAELAGFFLYCTQILGWLPPLIFTIMNENGVSLSWGGIHLNAYMLLGAGCYQMMPSWSSCLAIVREENKILSNKDSTIEVA
mmetsp:Transcript_26134/g.30354  ORF Transcript_26134/g.30354 Transcript_26134/m.30354 type:complete len:486 (+) Transcript_26134:142-1599(+)